jgi:4-amino-4-deoxy-L-arabinose transferase-like glycosyltransferase
MLAKRAWLLFFTAAFVLYLYGLGRLPLIGPDEPRYAQIAREMLERADPVTPTLGGLPWFEKPSLLYWMMMAAFAAFGVSEWAARLGPACSGLLTGLLIYAAGRRVEKASAEATASAASAAASTASSASAASIASAASASSMDARGLGLWSGASLLSGVGMLIFSRGASFDVIVTMTLTAALACFLVSELATTETMRRRWLAGFYAWVGASLLAKGLIGIVIPFGVVAAYFLLRREWPRRRALLSMWWGVPLALIVASVWYAPVTLQHGWTFIDQFIIQHHFARYLSNKYRHPQPFYFYLPMMALLALPWTPFLVAALARARRWNWRGADSLSKLRVLALAWVVVPVAFFSLSGSKLPGYILPALPGAALLIGDQLAAFTRDAQSGIRSMRATGACLLLLGGAIIIYLTRVTHISTAPGIAVALPLVLAGLFALLARPRLRRWSAALVTAATFATTTLAINLAIEQGARGESVRDLVAKASQRGYASAPVFELHTVERTAEFYAAGRVARGPGGDIIKFEGVQQVAEAARRSNGPALVIVPLEYAGQLLDYAPLHPELIGDNGEVALVVIRAP